MIFKHLINNWIHNGNAINIIRHFTKLILVLSPQSYIKKLYITQSWYLYAIVSYGGHDYMW